MDLLIIVLAAALFHIGGSKKENYPFPNVDKKPARVMLLPILLALTLTLKTHNLLFLLSFGSFQILRVGYGDNSFLKKIFPANWVARGSAALLYAVIGGSVFYFKRNVQGYFTYAGINGCLIATLSYLNAPAWIIESASGIGVASILWLI